MMDDESAFLKYQNYNKLGFHLCRYSLGFLKQLRRKGYNVLVVEPPSLSIHEEAHVRKCSNNLQVFERETHCLLRKAKG